MIDLHCHILPGVDDGALDMDEALSMAEIAVQDGIRVTMATPHVRGEVPLPPAEIHERVDRLNGMLRDRAIPLEVLAGAEVYFQTPPDTFAAYGLAGTRYVLLEFPHHFLPTNADSIVFALRQRGLNPIIAHPERNDTVVEKPDVLLPLIKPGVLTQITAASLTGEMGPDVRRCAVHLLRLGVVRLIATDSHSAKRRTPRLSEGLRVAAKIVGQVKAQEMVQGTPQRIIHGQPV
ncbi:MAG: hypothetical protein BWK76_10320 [Desulfobulbaceae bacterium A2]|nr:MAG: hypothetical protein BWK76_10320 [Desulfobulbaceae bacterium A2]